MSVEIEQMFSYHIPDKETSYYYDAVRKAAKDFAYVIKDYVPEGADKDAAIRKLRECMMLANSAISIEAAIREGYLIPYKSVKKEGG